MADTVTPKLGLTKPEIGASSDSWGNKTNANWDIIDQKMVRQTKQWTITMGDDTAGSSAGYWALTRYGNDELPIDSPITVNRQTAAVAFTGPVHIPNALTAALTMTYQAAPAAPPAGVGRIYFDANGNPVVQRPDGTVMHLGLAPGMITYTGATTPDAGCAFLNGQEISRAANPILFSRYGTIHGAGNGSTTFNLPNAQGRVFAHYDGGGILGGQVGSGQVGAIGGQHYTYLSGDQMPSHRHSAAMYDPSHGHSGGPGNVFYNAASSYGMGTGGVAVYSGITGVTINGNGTGVRVNSDGGLDTTYASGGNNWHPTIQPTIIMYAQVKLG